MHKTEEGRLHEYWAIEVHRALEDHRFQRGERQAELLQETDRRMKPVRIHRSLSSEMSRWSSPAIVVDRRRRTLQAINCRLKVQNARRALAR